VPRSFSHRISAVALVTAACVAACGGARSPDAKLPPAAGGAASTTSAPVPAPGPGEWATWTHAQKLAYMQTTFMEEERKVFASWEPVRFRELDCRTCHGPGARDGSFKLPNEDLAHLVPGKEGYEELFAHEPELFRFMQKTLVPETARLLGLPAFDMEKHTGFSCYQCHVKQGS
jgi:hypothetical protein